MFKLAHIGIVVSDIEQAVKFYEYLGFKLKEIKEVESSGLRLAYMIQDNLILELMNDGSSKNSGIKHMALYCENIKAVFEDFQRSGFKLLHQEIQEFEGMKFFFVQGFAGEWLEFVESAEEQKV